MEKALRELIIGGARSGKSALAEQRAAASGLEVVYVATAQSRDGEMARRIAHHRERRPAHWGLREEPLELAALLAREASPQRCLLVDCLTLWLSNLMLGGHDVDAARRRLLDGLPAVGAPVVMVSNEVGLGIVPENKLAREFRDQAGILHQGIAAIADRVVLVAAGLPLTLKDG